MLLRDLINEGTRTISSLYPETEAREMVFAYLEHLLGTSRHTHIVEPSYEVSDEDVSAALAAFGRMASGEPLQYVVGRSWFYGRQFNVTPDVLIPRPETEILCREVCDSIKAEHVRGGSDMNLKILDLCTGSGCIAWTLALENPGASVTGVDISDGALSVALRQSFDDEIALTGAIRPVFLKADVLTGPSGLAEPSFRDRSTVLSDGPAMFDIIVSNPPYVMDSEKALMRPNVLDHEPHLALFVPDDDPLVFYRAITDWARTLLKPGGLAIVEINEALGPRTADLCRAAGFSSVRLLPDLNSKDRFVSFRR